MSDRPSTPDKPDDATDQPKAAAPKAASPKAAGAKA